MIVSKHILSLWIISVSHVVYISCSKSQKEEDIDWDGSLDSFLESMNSVADLVADFVGDENGCVFHCKNGAEPRPNATHKPKSNGCGSLGLQIDTSFSPAVTSCCDNHDYCYDTCNERKEDCDDKFRDCLLNVCKKLKGVVNKDGYEGCKTSADLMYAGTLALGCKPYKDSQKQACTCQHGEL